MSRYAYTAKITGRASLNAQPKGFVMQGELEGDHLTADHPLDLFMALVGMLDQSGQLPQVADEVAIALVRQVPPAVRADAAEASP